MEIQLTRGHVTIVDDNAPEEITRKRWYAEAGNKAKTKFYAASYTRINGKKTKVYLHRLLTNVDKGNYVDHINGDTLDNRIDNLRACNPSQNQMNRCVKSSSISGIRGVSFEKKTGKWTARIKINGRSIWLGRFLTKGAAMRAYNNAAQDYFGEFCPEAIRNLGAAP